MGLSEVECYAPINSKVQNPPRATPGAFELLKIGLFKFPPFGAKKPVQMPHQLVLNYLSSKTNFIFNQHFTRLSGRDMP